MTSCRVNRSPKPSLRWVSELLWSLITLRVRIRYKETLLGFAWFLLQPVALTILFTYLFNRFARIASGDIPYTLFVAMGLVPWSLTALVVTHGAFSLTSQQLLLKRVALPKILLPFSAVVASGVDLAAMIGLLVALFMHYQISLSGQALDWVLVLLGIHVALLVGLSLLVSLANVFFRDVGLALTLLLQLWLFASPVFYPASLFPEELKALVRWNPMTGLIEGYRVTLLLGQTPSLDFMGSAALVSLGVLAVGLVFFWRFEGTVTDLL